MSIFLCLCVIIQGTAIAQECDGSESFTTYPGDLFETCWDRNHPNDNVYVYRIYRTYSAAVPPHSNRGILVGEVLDEDCDEVHCFSGPKSVNEVGTHYLRVYAFDNYEHYSDASNHVVLTIIVNVIPEPIQLRIISVVKEEP